MRQDSVRRIISICRLVLLIAVFGLTSSYFLASKNVFAFLRDASVTGMLAVGVTFVIITAGIDLSTGALTALCAMIMANIIWNATYVYIEMLLAVPSSVWYGLIPIRNE